MKKYCLAIVVLALFVLNGCNDKPTDPPDPGGKIFVKERSPFIVTENGAAVEIPFLGGFNDPKPSLIDFDGDGLTDLMVGQIDGTLLYLKNTGSLSQPEWTPIQDRLGGIDIGTWHAFCDIDADGDLDLFCDSRNRTIKFYRNISAGASISFVLETEEYSSLDSTGLVSLKTGINNSPTFADIDNDGDPDYFYGAISGKLEFHRNFGTPTDPELQFVSDFYDSIIAYPLLKVGTKNVNHGFSFIRFADIDSDNDLDL
ncbi:MAG: VCBS repeat-containing protein, partial [candidate division Zixibacteria bacterium]